MSDPITRSGSNYSTPRDANRVPATFGVSTVDGVTPVPLEVDPSNGQLQVSGSGGGGGNSTIINPLGSTTAASSVSTVLSDDYASTAKVELTNGTNAADVVAGDTGFNGVATAAATKTITFTSSGTGAQNIGPFNVEGYSWVEIVYSNVGTGLAVSGQFSPTSSGTYATTATWQLTSSAIAQPTLLGATVNVIYSSMILGNFLQLAVTALTGAGFAGTITLYGTPKSYSVIGGAVGQNGTWSVGLSAGANAIGSISNTSFIATQTTATNLKTQANTYDGSGNAITSTNGALNVVQQAATGTLTQVNSSATSVTILASNTSRKGATIYNNSTAVLYLAFASSASATVFTVPLIAAVFFEMPAGYTGIVSGIWASANGNAVITEIT